MCHNKNKQFCPFKIPEKNKTKKNESNINFLIIASGIYSQHDNKYGMYSSINFILLILLLKYENIFFKNKKTVKMRKWTLFSIKNLLTQEEIKLVSAVQNTGGEINWNVIKEPRRFRNKNRKVSGANVWDIAGKPQFFDIKRLD